jgi:HK97 family phage prohead protease
MDFKKYKDKKIVAYSEGDFAFKFRIEKALNFDSTDGKMYVGGIASSPNVDHDQERMSVSALERMANIINEKSVPLRIEHHKGDDAIIGKVTEGEVDERGNLNIKAELNLDDPRSKEIYNAMKSGSKMGFSVGGRVKSAVREMVEGMGKKIKTFYDVILDEVSLTPRPANFDAYAVAKSIVDTEAEADQFRFTPVYDKFLFDNPQLDYLAAIEKSIPDNKWIKVDQSKENNNIMNKIFGKGSTSDETVLDEKKAVDDAPESDAKVETETASKQFVQEAIKSAVSPLIDLLKGIRKDIAAVDPNAPALDSENPKEEKSDWDVETETSDIHSQDEKDKAGEETTKSKGGYRKTAEALLGLAKKLLKAEREGQEDSEGNGTQDKTEVEASPAADQENPESVKTMKTKKFRKVETGVVEATEATDQNNPAETKPDEEHVEATKSNRQMAYELMKTAQMLLKKDTHSSSDTHMDDMETEKDSSSSDHEETESTKGTEGRFAMSDDEEGTDTMISTHDIPDTSEKTNSYGEEYNVTSKKSVRKTVAKGAPIDLLVAHISHTLDQLMEKSQKDHHRILGLETQFMDSIYKNDELQKQIKELNAIPGPKKSVSMGIPYMFTKEGKRYPLIRIGGEAHEESSFNKSTGKPKSFKDLWKNEKSTMYDEGPGLNG